MPPLPLAEIVWLFAGLGLGIALSMVFLAAMVEADVRRLRRRLRPATVAAAVTVPLLDAAAPASRLASPRPVRAAPKAVVAAAEPAPEAAPGTRREPEPIVDKPTATEPVVAVPEATPPQVETAEQEPPPKRETKPAPGKPRAKPLSVEEMFAQAFKAADIKEPPPAADPAPETKEGG